MDGMPNSDSPDKEIKNRLQDGDLAFPCSEYQ